MARISRPVQGLPASRHSEGQKDDKAEAAHHHDTLLSKAIERVRGMEPVSWENYRKK